MMKFLDLQAQYQSIKTDIDSAIQKTINATQFIMGPAVAELESKIASYCGVSYGIGLNSGTDALFASLKALGIMTGDEVITTPFTFIASADVIALTGAKPVFVDINPETFNIDPRKIRGAITKKTKAIIPVHLYGQCADMDPIIEIAKKHNLFIIEDAAQALGAEYHGKKACSMGTCGCISFFPSKNLGAYGDGGMVVTNDKKVADYIKTWRVHGARKKYNSDFIGDSSRLDNLQAAILLAKFPHLDGWNAKRLERATYYSKQLSGSKYSPPVVDTDRKHVFHQYTIRVPEKRDKVALDLKSKGIPTMVYYPIPLHLQPAFSYLGYKAGDFPESERACKEVLSLPIYPELADRDTEQVVGSIMSF
ncbi:MAG: DegT/DnrJ/EryC1/StrS family aminotransferase, partial [Parcubacteria group bacterium]